MKKIMILAIIIQIMVIASIASAVEGKYYDSALNALQKLKWSISEIRLKYPDSSRVGPMIADAGQGGVIPKGNTDNALFAGFAGDLENVADELSNLLEENKKVDQARDKEYNSLNPPAVKRGKMSLGGVLQTRYYDSNGDVNKSTFQTTLARLALNGTLNQFTKYTFVGEFATTPKLLDAFATFSLSSQSTIRVGQVKPKFYKDFMTSSTQLPFVTRSLANSIASDYDVGMDIGFKQKVSNQFGWDAIVGVFNGAGINRTDDNSWKNMVARVELTAMNRITFGPNYYFGKYNTVSSGMQEMTKYGGNITWQTKSSIVEWEYLYSENNEAKQAGWYAWSGYLFGTGWNLTPEIQPVVRYEQFDSDVDTPGDHKTRLTFGTNLWFDKRFAKFQIDYQVSYEGGNEVTRKEFLTNLQVEF